jgi:hypothetical protein
LVPSLPVCSARSAVHECHANLHEGYIAVGAPMLCSLLARCVSDSDKLGDTVVPVEGNRPEE